MTKRHVFPQYVSEFIGTFFLVFFGCGSAILTEVYTGYSANLIPFAFGGTVAMMIYATGHISGAHFNPAVTLAFWATRNFPTHRIPGYILAQCAGAILASLFHYLIWGDTHSFAATTSSIGVGTGFGIEVILSFALMFVITSVATDNRAIGELAGIAIGLAIAICAAVGGPLTGASMNPARSLGPAILSGEYTEIWLYILAPIIGTIVAAKTYEWIRCQKEKVEDSHGCC